MYYQVHIKITLIIQAAFLNLYMMEYIIIETINLCSTQ
jgi:hypothetical protein